MNITATVLLCLTLNVYHEARGEPIQGQQAVALVTLQRAKLTNKSPCQEVFKPHQFSWTMYIKQLSVNRNSLAWRTAQTVAKIATSANHCKFPLIATHFHARQIKPSWSKVYQQVAIIGNHIFYRGQYGQTTAKN